MEERIIEILDESVRRILNDAMHEKGIQSGDIGFDHEYDINRLEEELAKVIASAIKEVEDKE